MIWWPSEVPVLSYGLLSLRPVRESDILEIFQACQDPLIPQFTTVPLNYSMADANYFVREKAPQYFAERKEILFVITTGNGEDEKFCGVISFHTIDLGNHAADLGYWIAASARGKGYGTQAAKLITRYGIETMGFRRIAAQVDPANIPSKALLMSVGFELEGAMRNKVTGNDGSQKDMALFSLLA